MQRNAIILSILGSVVAVALLLWLVRSAAIEPPTPTGDSDGPARTQRQLDAPSIVGEGELPPTAGELPDDATDPVQRQRGRLMKTIARLKARRTALADSDAVSSKTLASLDDHVGRLRAQVRELRGRP